MFLKLRRARAPVPLSKQCGIGLPATVFIISILALIVVALGELNQTANLSFGQSFQSQRAFYAAESGAQVGLNRIFVGGTSCNNAIADIDFDSAGPNLGLDDCTADLSCSLIAVAGTNYYTLSSTAVCGSGFEQAERTIQVRARSN
jgi:MSHA biogenesis protein MshP